MSSAARRYFADLNASLADAWNRFWFTPSAAAPLGVVRIAAGALAMYAVASYGPDLRAWFDAEGMLPLPIVRELYPDQWSLLDYVSGRGLWAVYSAAIAAAALLTVGVGGRIAAVATLVLTLSFFHRAPLVTGEFEAVLALLLAYLCLGRAGDALSLSALFPRRRGDSGPAPPTAANRIALRLIQVHIGLIHVMMAIAMFAAPGGVWFSGEGIWLAAARPEGALVDLTGWEEHTKLFALASHATTAYFAGFPFVVINRRLRPLALAAAAIAWPLLAIVTGKVLFCLAMAAGVAAFIPAQWLSRTAGAPVAKK